MLQSQEEIGFQFVPMSEKIAVDLKRSVEQKRVIRLGNYILTEEDISKIDGDDFWSGIESVGDDSSAIIEMIKKRHPVAWYLPDPRHNRRELYKSISYLRNHSKEGWKLDKKAELKPEPAPVLSGRYATV